MSYTRKQKKHLRFAATVDRIFGEGTDLSRQIHSEVRRVEKRKREQRRRQKP